MVCADVAEIGEERVLQIAQAYVNEEQACITQAVRNVMEKFGCTRILTVGVGSGLLSSWLDAHDLNRVMGSLSDAMPAWAVREAGLRTV